MEFDLENPLIISDDDQQQQRSVEALFDAESDHMVSSTGAAVDIAARRDAVALVLQFGCTLDPLVAFLAINYIDRFLCRREISEKPWIVRLLSVSCISLASKMKKSRSVLADLQGEGGIVFDAQSVRRMELLVLAALDWRMRSITPFSFLRFFVSFFAPAPAPLLRALKSHASQIILKTQCEVKMLRFKPSVAAAAALLAAAYELFPAQFPTFRAAVYSCEFVNKDELWECGQSMSSLAVDVCDAPASDSPVTVFGRHCSSSESEAVVGSSPDVGRETKKRRFSSDSGGVATRIHSLRKNSFLWRRNRGLSKL